MSTSCSWCTNCSNCTWWTCSSTFRGLLQARKRVREEEERAIAPGNLLRTYKRECRRAFLQTLQVKLVSRQAFLVQTCSMMQGKWKSWHYSLCRGGGAETLRICTRSRTHAHTRTLFLFLCVSLSVSLCLSLSLFSR